MSKISRCCRRLRHSSTLLWRSTCRAIIFLVVLYISQSSASFPEVVNNHVEDQVSVTGGIIAESGGGREDRTLDIIGALDHTEPGEVDVAAGSGVSTFYSYAVELWILESKLPFAKSLSRRALSVNPPPPASPPATPAPAPHPARSSPAPAPHPARSSPAPAPHPARSSPAPAPHPARSSPAPAPANATSSPTPAPTPVPRRPPAPAPTPIPAPPPTSGNSEPSSSSRGLNSKTVVGISLVAVGGVLFALFVALVCFVSKRVRGKERIV